MPEWVATDSPEAGDLRSFHGVGWCRGAPTTLFQPQMAAPTGAALHPLILAFLEAAR